MSDFEQFIEMIRESKKSLNKEIDDFSKHHDDRAEFMGMHISFMPDNIKKHGHSTQQRLVEKWSMVLTELSLINSSPDSSPSEILNAFKCMVSIFDGDYSSVSFTDESELKFKSDVFYPVMITRCKDLLVYFYHAGGFMAFTDTLLGGSFLEVVRVD